MFLLIVVYLISLIPTIFIYLFLRNRNDDEYKKICKSALLRGMFLSTFLVFIFSTILYFGEIGLRILKLSSKITTIYRNFIMFAFSEELIKYLVFKNTIKKYQYNYSNLDLICLMMIVGTGFHIVEALVYSLISNPITIIVTGLTLMHTGYAFIMGYFIVKAKETNNKIYTFLSLFVPMLIHGLYDLSLSDGFVNQDIFIFIAIALVIVSIVTIIKSVIYIKKRTPQENN